MQCYSIPVPSLNTAQQYAETAGSLAEALHSLFLRRPMPITNQSNPGAQAAYYRAVGAWYMENNDIIAAALMACRLLSDGAALELDNVREAAESPAEPPSVGGNGPNAAGHTSSLPEPQSRENDVLSQVSADMAACLKVYQEMQQGKQPTPQAGTGTPGGVLFYRQALVNRQTQQPKPTCKQKGRAATSAGE